MKPGQPTYEQQWQKITSAYLNNELEPWDCEACFIGNILNGDSWSYCRTGKSYKGEGVLRSIVEFGAHVAHNYVIKESSGLYMPYQIVMLENNFLKTIWCLCDLSEKDSELTYKRHPNYESALYEAMVSTLELLRQIHEAAGDETAKEIPLKKRELVAP